MKTDVSFEKMSSEAGLDVLVSILPHLETILQDPDYVKLKNRVKANKELTMLDIMGDAYMAIAVKNRAAVYGIVGAFMGKSMEEVAAQPLDETLSVFQGVMGSAVLDFFTFCARMAVRM